MRFTFNLNLPHERGDGLDGVRHREQSDQRQARVRQTRMNTLADGPDMTFSRQSREGLDRIIGHNVVKLAHQTLIGPEAFAQKHAEFHRRLGQTTHKPLITLLLDSIRDLIAEVRTRVASDPGLYDRVMPGHLRILDAVSARDPQRACEAMMEHLTTALAIQKHIAEESKP